MTFAGREGAAFFEAGEHVSVEAEVGGFFEEEVEVGEGAAGVSAAEFDIGAHPVWGDAFGGGADEFCGCGVGLVEALQGVEDADALLEGFSLFRLDFDGGVAVSQCLLPTAECFARAGADAVRMRGRDGEFEGARDGGFSFGELAQVQASVTGEDVGFGVVWSQGDDAVDFVQCGLELTFAQEGAGACQVRLGVGA